MLISLLFLPSNIQNTALFHNRNVSPEWMPSARSYLLLRFLNQHNLSCLYTCVTWKNISLACRGTSSVFFPLHTLWEVFFRKQVEHPMIESLHRLTNNHHHLPACGKLAYQEESWQGGPFLDMIFAYRVIAMGSNILTCNHQPCILKWYSPRKAFLHAYLKILG